MIRTIATGVIALFFAGPAFADDLKDVTTANNDFYVALSARDADMMAKVYAHEPYVANIEPGRSGLEIGWPGVEKWARSLADIFNRLSVTPSDVHVRINGSTAWVVEREHATGTLKDGTTFDDGNLVSTNIYEKQGERWLMVSHQAQNVPK